jgi:hypothetical protein
MEHNLYLNTKNKYFYKKLLVNLENKQVDNIFASIPNFRTEDMNMDYTLKQNIILFEEKTLECQNRHKNVCTTTFPLLNAQLHIPLHK